MPQVDLETLLCGGDGKVACETMTSSDDPSLPLAASKLPEEDPDMPAESFQLRIGDDIDWIDIHAVFERDVSTKGFTNPKTQLANPKQQPSTSQRFSRNLKPNAPIIALPNKIQRSGYITHRARRKSEGRMLPKKKRVESARKSVVSPPEPGSPKVSCFGKVLSDRELERSEHLCWVAARSPILAENRELSRGGSRWFWKRLTVVLQCGGKVTQDSKEDEVKV